MKIFASLLLMAAAITIAAARWAGVDMTEGRQLIEFWPMYFVAILCVALAVKILKGAK